MTDPDSPPRLRVRLLVGFAVGIVLVPVLYIAALGPVQWWDAWHARDPEWFGPYYRSVQWLYQAPPTAGAVLRYGNWWRGLPAPRSWQREQKRAYVRQLTDALEAARITAQKAREAGDLDAANAELTERTLLQSLHTAEHDLQQFDRR